MGNHRIMKEKCEVEGCGSTSRTKGLCQKHYLRRWRGGDPHTPGLRDLSPEERFRSNLTPQDPVTGCIEWARCCNKDGYGQINLGGRVIGAHRFAYELKYGPIPEGMKICHTCDNPPCCNNDHLFLGTDADNMADMVSKGRSNKLKGEKHGNAKLTEANVVEIRRRLAAGEVQGPIAKDFGIHHSMVSCIKTGKNWKY